MRVFVVRAQAASTQSELLRNNLGGSGHSEILAHCMMNAMFLAQSHRDDTLLYLVLEKTHDFVRTICFDVSNMQAINGFHEQAMLNKLCAALDASQGMAKEATKNIEPGITIQTISFEKLVKQLAEKYPLYLMDKKGIAIKDISFNEDACFLLTDHIAMPKKNLNSLKRLGCTAISLGPNMLFASQCISIIHNELDIQL